MSTCTTCCDWIWQCIMISVVLINRLIGDLTILNSNFDDQSQFLETIFFSTILHMIKMHTLCFFYLCLIQKYTFCVSIIISTLFLQVFSRNFMKNAQHMMCGAHGKGSMYTKKTTDHRSLWWNDDQSSNLYRFPKNQIIVWCSTQHGVTSRIVICLAFWLANHLFDGFVNCPLIGLSTVWCVCKLSSDWLVTCLMGL